MADNSYDFAPKDEPEKSKDDSSREKPVVNYKGPEELQQERTCPHCGFKMYGKLKARCPDCAAPLDHEATDILQFSDTSWLRSVSTGYLLILSALIMHLVAAGLRWNMSAGAIRVTLHIAAALVMVLGVFMATKGEPSRSARLSGLTSVARFAAIGSLLFWIPLTLLAWNMYSFKHEMILFAICVLMSQGTLAATLGLYTSGLAARVPDDSLATQAINAGWAVTLACLIMAVLHFLGMSGALILIFCSFPLIGALLAIFLWAATIPVRIASSLRSAAVAADAIAYRRAEAEAKAREKMKKK